MKIAGRTIKVKYVEGIEHFPDGESGLSFLEEGIIKIDKSKPKEHQESTLIHEILEFINSLYELELEHYKITCLETALYQVIKDNYVQ